MNKNKYQKALDELRDCDDNISPIPRYDTLQELITKHEKLREYLINEWNEASNIQKQPNINLDRHDTLNHYKNGIRVALDYLDKENEDA